MREFLIHFNENNGIAMLILYIFISFRLIAFEKNYRRLIKAYVELIKALETLGHIKFSEESSYEKMVKKNKKPELKIVKKEE